MLTVRVPIADPDGLLVTWGAGALVRLESSTTEGGSYTEVTTAALLAGLFEYYLVDPAGTPLLWYRWRPSKASPAGPSDYGDYSDPWVAGGPYLTVDQFKAFTPTTLDDTSLAILLNAAAEDIIRCIGPAGPITERFNVTGDLIMLGRQALSIVSASDYLTGNWYGATRTTLAADDYALSTTGQTLVRLRTGTHAPFATWGWYWPQVTYQPIDDTATRQRVQSELVQLDMAHKPGITQETIGSYSVSIGNTGQWNYREERAAILATLTNGIGAS